MRISVRISVTVTFDCRVCAALASGRRHLKVHFSLLFPVLHMFRDHVIYRVATVLMLSIWTHLSSEYE
jgi:hypothetical protein